MSMVSRRAFLKCIGVSSAAVASAALLGGCSGNESSASSGNANSSNSGNHNNGNSNGNSGSNASSSSSSSASSSSSSSASGASSAENTVTSGDIGRGYKYRVIRNNEVKDNDKNIAIDQGFEIYSYLVSNMGTYTYFEDGYAKELPGYVNVAVAFSITNNSKNIKVPIENNWTELNHEADIYEFLSGKYASKYMEVTCGAEHIRTCVSSVEYSYKTPGILTPNCGGMIALCCLLPNDWTSATIKYTLPYDTKKYANFIIYKEDVR